MKTKEIIQVISLFNILYIYCMCDSSNQHFVDTEMEEISDSMDNESPGDLTDETVDDTSLEDMAAEETILDTMDPDASNPCEQELPSVISDTTDFCSAAYPDSCLTNPCGECQVCFIDISCWPRDSADAANCGCTGDGLCHALCNSHSDCGVDEECINLAWANGTDIVGTACLKVCWPIDDPSAPPCW